MTQIGIGIIGGGYMGKAHAVAMSSVGAVFDTALRPRLEMVCANSTASAEKYRAAYGFARGTDSWEPLVRAEKVEAMKSWSPDDKVAEQIEAKTREVATSKQAEIDALNAKLGITMKSLESRTVEQALIDDLGFFNIFMQIQQIILFYKGHMLKIYLVF